MISSQGFMDNLSQNWFNHEIFCEKLHWQVSKSWVLEFLICSLKHWILVRRVQRVKSWAEFCRFWKIIKLIRSVRSRDIWLWVIVSRQSIFLSFKKNADWFAWNYLSVLIVEGENDDEDCWCWDPPWKMICIGKQLEHYHLYRVASSEPAKIISGRVLVGDVGLIREALMTFYTSRLNQ